MSTTAQITANQANAQHSTGPRTAEGRAAAASNAFRHGLSSRDVVLRDGELEEFEELRDGLEADIKPAGILEREVFAHLVHSALNLRRARRLEAEMRNLFSSEEDPLRSPDLSRDAERYHRYYARAERTFHKSLKALRDLQTQRMQRLVPEEIAQEAPPLADAGDLAKRTQIVTPDQAMKQLIRAYEQEPFRLQGSATALRNLDHLVKLAAEGSMPVA